MTRRRRADVALDPRTRDHGAWLRRPPRDDAIHRTRAPADPRRRGDRAELRALARRAPAADRRDSGGADGCAVRGARRHRSLGADARALPHDRRRSRDARGDRRPAPRPRDPGRADPRGADTPAPRPRGRPAVGRLPTEPPADEDVPRRPDRPAGRRLREPLPHGEAGRRRLLGRGRGVHAVARRAGGRRDRERAALRVVAALGPPARVDQRDRQRDGVGARARAVAGARGPPPTRARGRAARSHRPARGRRASRRRGGRRGG